jgi:hypothetical protein
MWYGDLNGMYELGNIEQNNPYWQGDYATVWFRYFTPNQQPYADKDVYVYGELTNYEITDAYKMKFNAETGMYESSLFLKQGNYDYMYIVKDRKTNQLSADVTEGNWWEAENNYTILVYHRPLGGRADELVGITTVNSLAGRPNLNNRTQLRVL